jgi:MerR family transcriptional regulator, thiopeptide resistance regulator
MSAEQPVWRIGDLAAAAGLTVRTLHHYDQVGLLRPSERSEGGHRLYTEDDARRLHEIVALRGLGLSLDQIHAMAGSSIDPKALLAEQQRALTAQIAAAERLRARLGTLIASLEERQEPTAEDLLSLIRQTVSAEQLAVGYLSAEQAAAVGRRLAELGSSATVALRNELPRLYQQALAEYDSGTDPADPLVQALVEKIDEVSATLSGGDEQVTGNVRRMWTERGEEMYPGAGIPWAALAGYLDGARSARGSALVAPALRE